MSFKYIKTLKIWTYGIRLGQHDRIRTTYSYEILTSPDSEYEKIVAHGDGFSSENEATSVAINKLLRYDKADYAFIGDVVRYIESIPIFVIEHINKNAFVHKDFYVKCLKHIEEYNMGGRKNSDKEIDNFSWDELAEKISEHMQNRLKWRERT